MDKTIRLKINKEYAATILGALQQDHAVEIIEHDVLDTPQWQIDEVMNRRAYYHEHPEEILTWEEAKKRIKPKG